MSNKLQQMFDKSSKGRKPLNGALTAQIGFRVSRKQKETWMEAARQSRYRSLSAWIADACDKAAKE